MKKYIWDGEIDMGWEDMSTYLLKVSNKFAKGVLQSAEYSNNDAVKILVNEKSIERFMAVIETLSEGMEDIVYHSYEDLFDDIISGTKMKYWILLGAATEVTLQVFLSIYIEDYEKSNWQQWEEFATSEVKEAVFATIDKLIEDDKIKREYARSLKKAVNQEIKYHLNLHSIEKVMLDEIILFYDKNEIIDKDDIEVLRNIQSNRNCIHAYMDRNIGTWFDLQYCMRFFCYLLEVLAIRLPEQK